MIKLFEKITGDINPLHTIREYAQSNGHKDLVVYGMLTGSFYSTLVGMHLPGQYALLQSVDASFIAPVFPGDILTVSGEIIAVHNTLKQIEIKGRISNQFNKMVSRAKIRSGVYE